MVRYSLFGAYLMELDELRKVKPATLVQFIRTLTTCPKGKGKGKAKGKVKIVSW